MTVGRALAGAIALGVLIGPSQIVARIIEIIFGHNDRPIWTMPASASLIHYISPGAAIACVTLAAAVNVGVTVLLWRSFRRVTGS